MVLILKNQISFSSRIQIEEERNAVSALLLIYPFAPEASLLLKTFLKYFSMASLTYIEPQFAPKRDIREMIDLEVPGIYHLDQQIR